MTVREMLQQSTDKKVTKHQKKQHLKTHAADYPGKCTASRMVPPITPPPGFSCTPNTPCSGTDRVCDAAGTACVACTQTNQCGGRACLAGACRGGESCTAQGDCTDINQLLACELTANKPLVGTCVLADPKQCTIATQAADCAAGEFCLLAECVRPCASDAECGFGEQCIAGVCIDAAMISDRAVKANIASVDPVDMLHRVRELPIATWNYTSDDPAIRHIGPMAQDFAATFGVGGDDRHIHPVDGHGVALAAIQGLAAELERMREENAALAARLAALERTPGLG